MNMLGNIHFKVAPLSLHGLDAPSCPSGSAHDGVVEAIEKAWLCVGCVDGDNSQDQFLAQSMNNDRPMLTAFGIMVMRHGIPKDYQNDDAPLYIGLTAGSPPNNPYDSNEYLLLGEVPYTLLPQEDTWYWVYAEFPDTPIDLSTFHAFAVSITDACTDTQATDDPYWALACSNGKYPGHPVGEMYIDGWSAISDTFNYYNCTEGEVSPCTNPTGTHGQIDDCGVGSGSQPDTTHKYQCDDGTWKDLGENCPACPDCNGNGNGCTNPTGAEGDWFCQGTSKWTCTGGAWVEEPNSPDCIGCDCASYTDRLKCESATDGQGNRCCWWYQKYFWENPKCYPKQQNMMMDYLPIIGLGAAVGVIGVALILSRRRAPAPLYYPPPREKYPRYKT